MTAITAAALGKLSCQNDLPCLPRVPDGARAFPNPVSDEVRFQVFVPGFGSSVDGTVSVLDAAGRLVRSIRYEGLSRGTHVLEWNGESSDGGRVPTGVYFYVFEAEGVGSHAGKLLVLR